MEDDKKQIQIRLKTLESNYAVPDTTLSVPSQIGPLKLNKLVKSLLNHVENVPEFEFFIADDLLRSSLHEFIENREDINNEQVLDILYLEQKAAPEPQNQVNHQDWVAAVDVSHGLIVSGCYDNSVSLWQAENCAKLLQISTHASPVRGVAFIHVDSDKNASFVTVSHDQTVVLHQYDSAANEIKATNVGKGHARSVDCVAVDPTKQFVASGSFDANLKIWSAKLTDVDEEINGDSGSGSKKAKNSSKAPTRTPLVTLAGIKLVSK